MGHTKKRKWRNNDWSAKQKCSARARAGSFCDKSVKGREESDRFTSKPGKEVLVQCWECRQVETRRPGIGRIEEIRCSWCGGEVEVLEVRDEAHN